MSATNRKSHRVVKGASQSAREPPGCREARSVNQLEQNRALRHLQSLHRGLKMSVPELPAVLSYLRWLDRIESWSGRKYPTTINQVAERRRDQQMYSWGGDFGNPIALPRIKKHPDPEKYRSTQLKTSVFGSDKSDRIARKSKSHTVPKTEPRKAEVQKSLSHYYTPEAWKSERVDKKVQMKSQSANAAVGVRHNKKPTPFYVHAKEGFKYWPTELYPRVEPPTRYSFGDRFNPGRAGVVTDRIYARPANNQHYWTEFQQHQNPIGSGNVVSGAVLKN